MQVEFRAQLKICLEQHAAQIALQLDVPESSFRSAVSQTAQELTVAPTPPNVDGEISSSIAFELAAILTKSKTDRTAPVRPLAIAEAIQTILGSLEPSKDLFITSIGGAGFLNCKVTASFINAYIDYLIRNGIEVLFTEHSFINRSEAMPKSTIPTLINWDSFIRKVSAHPDAELSRFLEAARTRNIPDRESRIMLLGLLADPELVTEFFLNETPGRENIPWYLTRFTTCAAAYRDSLRAGVRQSGADYSPSTDPILQQQLGVRELLQFRECYLTALRLRRPEILFRAMLTLVRAFFNYFNRPNFRELPSMQSRVLQGRVLQGKKLQDRVNTPPEALQAEKALVCQFTSLLLDAVSSGLAIMELGPGVAEKPGNGKVVAENLG